MSEMVEHVARFLAAKALRETLASGMVADAGTPGELALASVQAVAGLWPAFEADARVAIEAMRDVDAGAPSVLVAGKRALLRCCEDPELEDARACWRAMIDAALEEPGR